MASADMDEEEKLAIEMIQKGVLTREQFNGELPVACVCLQAFRHDLANELVWNDPLYKF